MDGQLAQVCLPSHFLPELNSPGENSSPEVAELRAEVHRLRAENLELRMQAGYWQSRYRDAQKRITALEKKIEQLEGEKRQLQADLFGRRSETKPLNDRSNHLDDPQDGSQQPKRKRASNRRTTDPSGEIVPGCRFVRNSSIFPPSKVSARIAVNRYVSEVIPKTPSRSRSTCVPTAAKFDGGGTSGPAPARVDAPSLPHLLPS